jgi:hypothetical protein
LSRRPPAEETAALARATDVLNRVLWVGYRPDVAEAVAALEASALYARFDIGSARPRRIRHGVDAAQDIAQPRSLRALADKNIEFLRAVADNPDQLFVSAFQSVYQFALANLESNEGWFTDNDFTQAFVSEHKGVSVRMTTEDEEIGDVSARVLSRSLVFDCHAVRAALADSSVAWRRIGSSDYSMWAEGVSETQDVRVFAAAQGTSEVVVRGKLAAASAETIRRVAATLEHTVEPVESMTTVFEAAFPRAERPRRP